MSKLRNKKLRKKSKVRKLEVPFTATITLSPQEVNLIWNFVAHQYIPYDNIELMDLIRKLRKIIDELAPDTSSATQ